MKKRYILAALIILALLGFLFPSETKDKTYADEEADKGRAEKEISAAISEIKGWLNVNEVGVFDWEGLANPKGDGIIVAGSHNNERIIAYVVNLEKSNYERICAINGTGMQYLDRRVANGKVQYCENLSFDDVENFFK
ncbi:MAG: hypothetical protein J4203_07635 [Candidatus Diapherotrites archaeon]|uniref:Uncharacterized protein n=1 Tax=Candidatus Iainarchaeum sp. TaxID=3101447 RepID=A0A8T4LAJ1_9ARCH|nr:hypothetical protein [Candidatus Diapherotrites archaeon]